MYYFQGHPPVFLGHDQQHVMYVQAPVPPYGVFQYGQHLYLGYPRSQPYGAYFVPPPPAASVKKSAPESAKKSIKSSEQPKGGSKNGKDGDKAENDGKDEKAAPPSAKEDKSSENALTTKSTVPNHKAAQVLPSLRAGMNYMFPREHTRLHILCKATRAWEKKHDSKRFRFNIYKVGTQLTVKEVIQNTMSAKVEGDWAKCDGWAATEIIECGDGKWEKVSTSFSPMGIGMGNNILTNKIMYGTTIEYSGDKSDGTLASMGWSSKRGNTLPPVWITVHRAEGKKE